MVVRHPQGHTIPRLDAEAVGLMNQFIDGLETGELETHVRMDAFRRLFLRNLLKMKLKPKSSALDAESERIVQQALDHSMKNRTTVMIAHHLSTIQNADFISVLQEGKVVEQSTHSSLLRKEVFMFALAIPYSISTVTKLLGRIHYFDPNSPKPGSLPSNVSAAVNGVALCGTLAGQLFFRWLGDKMGQKKVYGITLILMVISSITSGLSFGHTAKSVMTMLCFFRFWLGFSIEGDYPLSATIMSEYTNKKTRNRESRYFHSWHQNLHNLLRASHLITPAESNQGPSMAGKNTTTTRPNAVCNIQSKQTLRDLNSNKHSNSNNSGRVRRLSS